MVAEPGFPTTWREAVPYVIWIVLVLGFGLEFTTNLVHGNWLLAILSFGAMAGLAAMTLHWPQLRLWAATVSPNWVVGSFVLLLLLIALLPFAEEKRWPFSEWFAGHLAHVSAIEAEKATVIEWLAEAQKERDQAIAERKSAQNGWAADRVTMEAMQSQSAETRRQLVDAELQKASLIEWLQNAQLERDQLQKNLQAQQQHSGTPGMQSYGPPPKTQMADPKVCADLLRQLSDQMADKQAPHGSGSLEGDIRSVLQNLGCLPSLSPF
jgi:hypothetical protein